jgi:hypothetical protein
MSHAVYALHIYHGITPTERPMGWYKMGQETHSFCIDTEESKIRGGYGYFVKGGA